MALSAKRDRDRLSIYFESIWVMDRSFHDLTDNIQINDPRAIQIADWFVEDLELDDTWEHERALRDFVRYDSGVKKLHLYFYPYCEVINTTIDEYGYSHISGVNIDFEKMSVFCEANRNAIINVFNSYISENMLKWNKSKLKVIYHFHRRDGNHTNCKGNVSDYDTICNYTICTEGKMSKVLGQFEYFIKNYDNRRTRIAIKE